LPRLSSFLVSTRSTDSVERVGDVRAANAERGRTRTATIAKRTVADPFIDRKG